MKSFKKILLLLSLTLCFFAFSSIAYAKEEEISSIQQEDILDFYGYDATLRDCKELNVREQASISSNVLSTISFKEHFKVVGQTGEWFQIEYKDISGFVFWKYVSFVEAEITEGSNLLGNSIIHYKSSENRDINMAIACSTINGTILQPGEEFRWSKIIGQTTSEKGYLSAPVIINKKTASGLGGGVCQVSTTIYNALLDTNIVPTELHHHSIGSAYAKNDATVAYGSKDFAFINTYDFPIQIEAYCYKAIVFVNIYQIEIE